MSLPLNEIVLDFYDRLKSVSRGYASLDYQLAGTLDFADGEDGHPDRRGPCRCTLNHRASRQSRTHRGKRARLEKMRELIPRQMFEVAIQAAIGSQRSSHAFDRYGHPQERDREVLRRRY